MKKLVWYKEGDSIPDNAVFIRTKKKVVRYEKIKHAYFDSFPLYSDSFPIYEDVYLYEIKSNKNGEFYD